MARSHHIRRSGLQRSRSLLHSGSSDREYEVETILAHRDFGHNRARYFLLKWKGYEESTWEPERNLTNCDELKVEYEARIPAEDNDSEQDSPQEEESHSINNQNLLMETASEEDEVTRLLSPLNPISVSSLNTESSASFLNRTCSLFFP
jgi:hypothetical protein